MSGPGRTLDPRWGRVLRAIAIEAREVAVSTAPRAERVAELRALAFGWVTREEYLTYFDSLPADQRWTNARCPNKPILWHWEERRWGALEDQS
jgi:hypothetical protein